MAAMLSAASTAASHDDVGVARQVLQGEIDGLQALAASLDGDFTRAVELLAAVPGRVITTGMGKSGHIARKMAATFASTGTPSFFVHPGEASHGDLGMITRQDALIMLSNSGETAELKDMIDYSRRFQIPVVAMVRRQTSALVDAADVALVLPNTVEALPAGAPSTSTTMMLALGDALAGALMHRRSFTEQDFHTFHPGGKLGKRFIKVKDLMHAGDRLPLVRENTSMRDVLPLMTAKGLGAAVVVNEHGFLQGIITDGDLRRHMSPELIDKTAGEVMTRGPKSIRENALAVEALGVMNSRNITSLLVVEEEKPVGIIHIHDCLSAGIG